MHITSRNNPAIMLASSLKDKKFRDREGLFLAEGRKLFREAVSSGASVHRVYCTEENYDLCVSLSDSSLVDTVTEEVLAKISTEKSPQGVICLLKYLDKIHNIGKIYTEKDFAGEKRRILLLSSLRDPGNLGTVIRSAAAFGAEELILSSDCADLYNPRTVRAAMGTLFRQRISYADDLSAAVSLMGKCGYRVYAAVLEEDSERLDRMRIGRETCFIVGNEGHGIDAAVTEAAGHKVYIPMMPGVESLNAAAAAAVFLWQSMTASD